jgi:hypothetical protein
MFEYKINDICEFYSISRSNVDKWRADPTFPQDVIVARGCYDLQKLNQWYLSRFYGSGELAAEKLKGQKLKNDKAELELSLQRNELIPKAQVLEEFLKRIYVLKSDLLSIEKRLPPNSKEKEIVRKSVRRILENYSRPTGVLRQNQK